MYLFIFLLAALALGYWLARSRYQTSIDRALQQPKKYWDNAFHRSASSESDGQTTESIQKKEE